MKKRTMLIFLVLYLIVGVAIGGKLFRPARLKDADITDVNKILKEVSLSHGDWNKLDEVESIYDFVVLNQNKKVCYQRGSYEDRTVEEAIRHHNAYEKQENLLVLVKTTQDQEIIAERKELTARIAVLYLGVGILLILYCIRWNRYYVKPFQTMKEFAHQIANGNLDYPLDMDQKNLFGAFTESFDLMREQLKTAKEQEYEANVSKKELVASLSHDIKSPVASIKVISEVLLAKEEQTDKLEKIQNIYESADRIDSLVSNLFESTLQDLQELKVEVVDEYANRLVPMMEHSDYKKRLTFVNQPEYMVQMDPVRMEQVITNIIANSYKYADTDIHVSFEREDEFLKITFKDFGPGVPSEELPLIFQKFYRGKNSMVKKQKGAGLGLYICRYCVEKMGGSIQARKDEDGFAIVIYLLLSE